MEITPSGSPPSEATLSEQLVVARAGRGRAHAKIQRLEEAIRAKDEFLSELTHELRTPLTAILGWASLLQVRQFDPEVVAQGLETIEQSARAQAELIDDLSDLARVASGKLRLDMRPMDLSVAVRTALEAVRPSAEAKGVRLDGTLSASVFMVRGDRNRLRQVVSNFLTNAVKFTPAGGTVTVWLERRDGRVRLTVRDTGVGISSAFLPYVFDRFRQAETANTPAQVGLGLGLAIVRHLVDLHGGHVVAESDGVGSGATFMLELPEVATARDPGRERPLVTDDASEPARVLEGLHLVLVEDDEASRNAIAALLEEAGADVLAAASADEALQAVAECRPDVVISDLRMPGHDGFSLLRDLRASEEPSAAQIPVVALTGGGREADRARALSEGFELYISKPVDGRDLANAVARLVPLPIGDRVEERN